ncbi:MAG: hypothetical protein ACKO96_35510 [Flammeovirgaceae bacterium]
MKVESHLNELHNNPTTEKIYPKILKTYTPASERRLIAYTDDLVIIT